MRHPAVQEMMREHAHATGLDGWAAWADLVREAAAAVQADRAASRRPEAARMWPAPHTAPGTRRGLALPDQVFYADEALQTIRELHGVLLDSLEPGRSAPTGGRYGAEAAPVSPWCDVCGGRRYWRRPTGHAPERRRPYCPRCDGGLVSLGEAPLPIVAAVHDTIVYTEAAVLAAEAAACATLGLTRLPRSAALVDRLRHLERMLPAIEDDAGLAEEVTRTLLSCARAARGVLRDREPMVRLPGRCPWCGSQSLVMWPERGDARRHSSMDGDLWIAGLIECTYRDCRCGDDECRCQRRLEVRNGGRPHAGFRHTWSNDRWAWLSRLIGVDLFEVARRGEAS